MKRLIYLSLILYFHLFAQNPVTVVNLDMAINLALEKNADLKVAKLELEKNKAKYSEALSGLYPKIDLSGQYQRYIEKPVIFLPPGSPFGTTLKIGSDNSFVGTASLSMPLFSYTLFEAIAISKNLLDISELSYYSQENLTLSNVKKSFYAVLLTKEISQVLKESLQNASDNLENIRKLNAAGTISDYDLLRADVQVENLKPSVIQADNNYTLSIEALKVAIGIEANSKIDVVGELVFYDSYILPTKEEIMSNLESNNLQLSLLDEQIKVTEKSIMLEKSAHLPTLSAFGNYQYQAQANDFRFSDYNWVSTFLVGVQLQIPVFNGFKVNSKVAQAEILLKQNSEQRYSINEALKTQALSILYRLEQAMIRIKSQARTVEQATEGYKIAVRRFENNLAIQLEVNDAELALRQSKLNRLQAIYDFKIAEADLNNLLNTNNKN